MCSHLAAKKAEKWSLFLGGDMSLLKPGVLAFIEKEENNY